MSEDTSREGQPNADSDRPELSAKPADKRPIIFGFLAGLIVILIFGVIAYFFYINPAATAIVRDIVIIFLGLGGLIIILLLIALVVIAAYLVIKVNDLVQLLDREIKPMLAKLQDTTGTVQGTATFLSDYAVQPVITTASTISGVKAVLRSLFRRS